MYNCLAELVYEEEAKETRAQLKLDDRYGTNQFHPLPTWLQVEIGLIEDIPTTSKGETEPSENLFLKTLPRNVIPNILQYIPFDTINSIKQVSKDAYKNVITNWKLLDRETIREFSISRSTPNSYMREILDMKTPIKAIIPSYRQDVFYVRIDCDTGKRYWWNYVLKDMALDDDPKDFENPCAFKRRNMSIPVWDMRTTLDRQITYFFQQCKVENLKIEDFNLEDLEILINCIVKTKLAVHRLTISLETEEFLQRYIDLINLIKPRELCITLFNKSIPTTLWDSPVLYACDVLRLRGFNACVELTNNILLALKATKLHIIGMSSITAAGLHEFIKRWYRREREFHSIYIMNRISDSDIMDHLQQYLTLGFGKMAVHSRQADGKLLYIGAERDLFVMSTVPRADADYDSEMTYLGGLKL